MVARSAGLRYELWKVRHRSTSYRILGEVAGKIAGWYGAEDCYRNMVRLRTGLSKKNRDLACR